MKKLGFGLMRLPQTDPADPAAIDLEQVKEMADRFLEKGFTYFDTAWMYQNFASEPAVREVLVDRHPRDSFTLATKLHAAFLRSPEDRDRIFYSQLEKTGAGYFDFYLLHGVEAGSLKTFEAFDCFSWLLEKKAQGLVKHAGFSFHDSPELLDRILTEHPEMEFVQLQLNYLDWNSPWVRSRECYETVRKHGLPVVVMEPVKGGSLARVPEASRARFEAAGPGLSVPSWAIRFAASLPGVMVVLSGMSSLEQMEDNLSFMDNFTPLTPEEQALCFQAAEEINARIAIPCTGCSYCTGGCPMHIAIPQYFSLFNEVSREDMEHKGWTASFGTYANLTAAFGKASDCIGCGQCEQVCPQHLPVIENLKKVAGTFEP